MAQYLPPTENVPIFDTLNFNDGNTPLTYNTAIKYFLRYPYAQGTENLQITNVNGLLTANAGIKANTIGTISLGTVVNLFTDGIVGTPETAVLNIGTGVRAGTASVNINTSNSSSAPTNFGGGNFSVNGTGNITINSTFANGALNICTASRTSTATPYGVANILTGNATGDATNNCIFNLGTGTRTYAPINIGSGTRDINSPINIGAIGSAPVTTPVFVNGLRVRQSSGISVELTSAGGLDMNSTISGAIGIGNTQISGTISIGTGPRSNLGVSLQTGEINIGTGTATGSTTNGVPLNIGTGNRTIYSDVNIGTGIRDTTSNLNIGFCATTGTNNGALHLQDGNDNRANVHIGNGTFNRGNVNICNGIGTGAVTGQRNDGNVNIQTGAYNNGDLNIQTDATGTGDVFIGNFGNTTGVTYLSSRNIEIGTNGAPTSVISLSAPLRPNYASTASTNNLMLGFQNITATSTTIPTSSINSIANTGTALDNGVWYIEAQFGVTWTGTPVDSLIVWSLSTTPATNDLTRMYTMLMNKNLISSQYNGRIETVFRLTGTAVPVYLVAQVNGTNPATSASAIRFTRIG